MKSNLIWACEVLHCVLRSTMAGLLGSRHRAPGGWFGSTRADSRLVMLSTSARSRRRVETGRRRVGDGGGERLVCCGCVQECVGARLGMLCVLITKHAHMIKHRNFNIIHVVCSILKHRPSTQSEPKMSVYVHRLYTCFQSPQHSTV